MTTEAGRPLADNTAHSHFSAWRLLLNAGAFLVAFTVLCSVVHMPVPIGEIPGPGFKFRYFAERKDEYDLIFVGSSRVFHHFIPEQFDHALLANSGTKIHSFNFGYDAMWPPESYYMLREALRVRPKHLKWVLIDLMQINPKIDRENTGSLRMAYWHDWEHTILALRALETEPEPAIDKFKTATGHVEHLFGQWVDRGRGADWIEKRLRPPDRKKPSPKRWEPLQGFEVGGEGTMKPAELEKFRAALARYEATPPPETAKPEFLEAAAKMVAMVRAAGAEPIFVLAPTIEQKENVVGLLTGVSVFSFADPAKYPALYDPVNHYDSWHLNEQGAKVFTNLLAERFAEHLGHNSAAPPNP